MQKNRVKCAANFLCAFSSFVRPQKLIFPRRNDIVAFSCQTCYTHRMNRLKTILRWLPMLFILGCNWHLSSQETIEYMPTFWNADKLVHCICYAGLAFWCAFAVGTKIPARLRILLPVIIVSVWGITDEIHQGFVPGREPSVFDWCADTIGATIGSLVFFYLCKWIELYKNRKERTNEMRG